MVVLANPSKLNEGYWLVKKVGGPRMLLYPEPVGLTWQRALGYLFGYVFYREVVGRGLRMIYVPRSSITHSFTPATLLLCGVETTLLNWCSLRSVDGAGVEFVFNLKRIFR